MIGLGLSIPQVAVRGGGSAPAPLLALFASGEEGAWYDPSDLSTMFQNSDGTTAAAVDSPVGYIADKSGNGNHATQSTAAARPTLRQTAGGLYYLEFDGVDDSLVTPTITPATDKAQTFAGVGCPTDLTLIIVEYGTSINSNTGSFYVARDTGPGFESLSRGSASVKADQGTEAKGAALAAPVSAVVRSTHDIAASITTIKANGISATATGDKGAGNFGNYSAFIGARNESSLFFDGDIYGLAFRFGPNLSTAQLDSADAFMAEKSGVTL